jgi:hypothetical protein
MKEVIYEPQKAKFILKIFALQILLMLFSFSVANAEEASNTTTVNPTLKIYFQGGYTHNLRNPPDKVNDYRVLDNKSDTPFLDMFEMVCEKDTLPTDRLGFKINAATGEMAKYLYTYGITQLNSDFSLTEAYIKYKFPLGSGLDVDMGKFLSPIGIESLESINNPNYSRTFLFYYVGPYTHTGVRAKYNFTSKFNASLYIVNGWDNFRDNNSAKTLSLCLGYNPSDNANMSLNIYNGPEMDNNNKDNRFLLDWTGTFKLSKSLTLYANYDYGSEKNTPLIGNTSWSGAAGYLKKDLNDKFSLSLRGEFLNDKDGSRTGTPQTLKEITFTPEIRISNDFVVKPEYRHDWSNKRVFYNGTRFDQDTLGIGVMYQKKW